MLWKNKPDREREILYGINYKWTTKKKCLTQQTVVARGCGNGTTGEMMVKRYKLSVITWTNSKDLMYNLVTIVNNTILHTWNLLSRSSGTSSEQK